MKRKSVVADVDVSTLDYKTSPTLSASSSLHDDRSCSSGSSNTAAEDEPTAGALRAVESPESLESPSRYGVTAYSQ